MLKSCSKNMHCANPVHSSKSIKKDKYLSSVINAILFAEQHPKNQNDYKNIYFSPYVWLCINVEKHEALLQSKVGS